ncbi:hypothetical protein OVS_02450 [Mycoplasma ovis str. Michigan]|uniref:DUF31 domain-containing protein n=1 Tax=Mycoplasma ovis str. Michigan TaxID=1415773 RepID=A0ABN4BRI6_9MOLU|nr:hypothetical protein [Mycoplasma ovis]AHC40329.1 hypothetical protein OVS_02450 [Mycoplasma ovis str. Michigan]
MNFLLNHWKEFSALGAIFLSSVGIFMSSSKSIEWTKPFGFYTQTRLFIEENGSLTGQQNGKVVDLLAEFPLKYLDKENWWKYCLPKGSKLNNLEKTVSTSSNDNYCQLDWYSSSHKHKNSESISYLLRLILKFLKLQNQLNLIFLFYSEKSTQRPQVTHTGTNGNGQSWLDKIRSKCQISRQFNKDSFLKNMFTSSAPISKNCLITPVKVDVTLSLNGTSHQVTRQTNTYSLEKLKKGTITGEVQYSLTDYSGNLHNFEFEDKKQSSALFSVFPSGTYKFKVNGNNGNLDFDKLFEKYQSRELDLSDFNLKAKK